MLFYIFSDLVHTTLIPVLRLRLYACGLKSNKLGSLFHYRGPRLRFSWSSRCSRSGLQLRKGEGEASFNECSSESVVIDLVVSVCGCVYERKKGESISPDGSMRRSKSPHNGWRFSSNRSPHSIVLERLLVEGVAAVCRLVFVWRGDIGTVLEVRSPGWDHSPFISYSPPGTLPNKLRAPSTQSAEFMDWRLLGHTYHVNQ
jgi:hypothetical protein